MKVKICVLTLLIVGLVFGFAVNSHAAVLVATQNVTVTNTVAAGDSFVVGSFKIAGALDEDLGKVRFKGTVSVAAVKTKILNVSLYRDVNDDGALDSGDTYLGKVADIANWVTPNDEEVDFTDINYDAAGDINVIVVVTIDTAEATAGDFDGCTISATAFESYEAVALWGGEDANDAGTHTVDIVATHLQFVPSVLNLSVGRGYNILDSDTGSLQFLLAVDDYSNIDTGFTGDGTEVIFSAESYVDGSDLSPAGELTAASGAAGDVEAAFVPAFEFTNGGIIADTDGGGAAILKTLSFDDSQTTDVGVTIVATTNSTGGTPTGYELQGSITVHLGDPPMLVVTAANKLIQFVDGATNTSLVTLTEGLRTEAQVAATIKTAIDVGLESTYTITWPAHVLTIDAAASTIGIDAAGLAASTAEELLGISGAIGVADPLVAQMENGAVPDDAAITGIAATRGIELYDTDHNGYLDHATLIFNTPVVGSPGTGSFTVTGYTVIGVEGQNFDAGGVGIRNVGEYGYTLTLTEKSAYDTNAKPEVQYTGSALMDRAATPNTVPTVNTAQAVEVDRARPVLLSALTKDSGIGIGIAANGRLDGLVLTFSEPVANYTAGPDSIGNGLYIDPTAGLSFNQGDGALDGSVLTIPIGETTINTGATPTVYYNLGVPVTDNATSATGATSPNKVFPDKTDYSLKTSFVAADGAPMVVYQVKTADDGDGHIDQIMVTFSENPIITLDTVGYAGVQFYSDISAFSSGTNANGIYSPKTAVGPTKSGATVTFSINPATNVYDTEALPNFEYNPDADDSDIKDAAGNELEAYGPSGLQHEPTIDGAKGVVVEMITRDAYTDTTFAGGGNFFAAGANGRIDGVELVFSEMMKTDDGAENGGTALDNVLLNLEFKHADTEVRANFKSGSTLGKPSWLDENINGDTSTTIKLFFIEMAHDATGMINGGDTGISTHTMTVSGVAADDQLKDAGNTDNNWVNVVGSVVVDGAAPFLVDGIAKHWAADAFANVVTVDSDSTVIGNTADLDMNNGNGYIDGFQLKFSEKVYYTVDGAASADSLKSFSVDLPGDGALSFKVADGITGQGAVSGILTILGAPDYKGDPDTDATPALSFDGKMAIFDGADANCDATDNVLAEFENKLTADGAAPVIVTVNGGAAQNLLNIKFSEPVTGYYTGTDPPINAPVDSLNKTSTVLFGYENLSTGVGATGFTSAYVTYGDTQEILVATINANLTAADIEKDLVWVRTLNLYDNANAFDSGLSDNFVENSIAGSNIKVIIFDDVVAPWISAGKTLDIDGDGLIDYIRFELSETIDDSSIKGFVSQDAMSTDVSATWKVSGYTGTAKWNFFRGNKDDGKLAAAAAGKPAFTDNTADDNILYLELEEALVPAYSVTGLGSTGFAPTVTWGVAGDAVTLSDFRPNVLNTAADPEETDPIDAVNGTVSDAVGPVIMLADYAAPAAKVAKETGGTVTMYFSEAVVIADPDTDLNTDDFYYSGDTTSDAKKRYMWSNEWINAGTLEITFKSDHSFAVSSAPQVQLAATDGADPAQLATQFEDAEENVALGKGGTLGLVDGSERADWFDAVSPMNDPPWKIKTAATLGAKTIAGLSWVAHKKTADPTPHAGESVKLEWTYANVENVDIYVSFNGGEAYEIIPGSTTPAADKAYYWTAKMGVTNLKVQSAEDATINFTTGITSVVYDGDSIGASIGAPSNLAMTDMPNDNGAFLIAQFGVSADHLTAVNSYQFYREYALDEADPNNLTEVLWAVVAAGNDPNVQSVIVPTIDNTESNWTVVASTGSFLSDRASKETGDAVATVVFGAAGKAASYVLSAASNVAPGMAEDNIAPSALDDFAAGSGETGIRVSWTAPEDHGIVGSFEIFGATNYIHGVDAYEVYRRIKGEDEFVLIGSAVPGSEFYNDVMEAGAAVYQYFVKAVDGNPDHIVETDVRSGIAATELSGDFSGDAIVDASDFSIFAANYGAVNEGNEAGYVWAYDLNADGVIDASDFSIFAAGYGATLKIAKAAALEMPTSDIPFAMGATIDESTSTYFLNVNIGETETLKGFEFYLSYNTEALEFVENSVNGLVGLNMTSVDEDGIIRVSNWFAGEQFDGTVTLAFRSTGVNSNLTFEILNAMVDDVDGLALSTNVSDYEARALPTVYALSQNYPNPFNPTTTIDYSIPKSGNVELVIFNMTGQKVRTLISGRQDAAFYKIVWDGRNELGENVASGLYFYRLVSGSFSKIEKMTLIK